MQERLIPFVAVEGVGVAKRAGQHFSVPVTFPRPLPYVPKPLTVLWTELVNCRYMGMQAVTAEGCTLIWKHRSRAAVV